MTINKATPAGRVAWPYIQHPTPYPGTPMTKDFQDRGLIINERLEEYDGTTAVVRTEHLSADEVEFLRWKSAITAVPGAGTATGVSTKKRRHSASAIQVSRIAMKCIAVRHAAAPVRPCEDCTLPLEV